MRLQANAGTDPHNNPDIYVLTYRENELSWRCVVFLPFNFAWRMLMAVFGCIYFSMVIFEEVFMKDSYTKKNMKLCDDILSLITICYYIDFVLSLLHRTWGPVQKSMPHQPKTLVLLFIDLVSILPIRRIKLKPFISKDKTVNWIGVMNLNGCLRVYRIFVELIRLQQKMWLNPILVCIVQQNALLLSLVSILCSIWYAIGFVKHKNPLSWIDDMQETKLDIDLNKPTDMYIISFLQVFAMLCNEVVADVRSLNKFERCFVIATIFAGSVIRHSYVIANLIHSYLKYQGHMYKIKDHIAINKRCLAGIKEKKITEYYITFWTNWMGLHKCPVLDKFPLCIRKDVLTDVYWNAFEHSHVLRHFPDNIKRQFSLVMKSKFLQPGDHIFRKGEIRNCYYYIASGLVQIMSHYDGVSPIMTITSGSCIGGMALLLPSPCPTDVICATICEVRFLTFRDFHNSLEEFMNGTEIAQRVEQEHIQFSKRMYVLSKAHTKEDPIMKLYGVPQDDKLKWLKKRWRVIHSLEQLIGSYAEHYINKVYHRLLEPDVSHTSKYLDAIVLSNESKWDSDRCCMRTSCPYTLEPNCNFIKVWMGFIVVVITIDCICVPFCAAFLFYTPDLLVHWDHLVFFCYIIDIYLQAITAVKLIDKIVVEPMHLLRYHLSNIMFIIDVLATIPIREIVRFFVPEHEMSPFLALPRLLKIVRVFGFFKTKYNNITVSNLITHVIKYVYMFFFIGYFAACFIFILACAIFEDIMICVSGSWFNLLTSDISKGFFPAADLISVNMTMSLYCIVKFVTSCGLSSVTLQRSIEIVYITVLVFISKNVIHFVYSELIAMDILRQQRRSLCFDLIKSLKSVLTMKKVHHGLIRMLETYIELQWEINYAIDLNIQSDSIEIISPILKTDRQQTISDSLKKIHFFSELDALTFEKVVNSFKIFKVPNNYIFCRAGEIPTSFNIILKGICNLTSMLKEDMLQNPDGKLIGPGSHFPLLEIINNTSCLQTTVSATVCELITIDMSTLKSLLFQSEEQLGLMVAKVSNLNDLRLDVGVSKNKYSKDKAVTKNLLLCRKNRKQNEQGCIINKLWFLNYCIDPHFMIHPHGRFMYLWEMCKFIQISLTLFYLPTRFTFSCSRAVKKFSLCFLLDLFSISDVCLRFYLGHYNKDGVLVHYFEYYFTHSFTVDIVSSLPWYYFLNKVNFSIWFYGTCAVKSLQMYRVSGFLIATQRRYQMSNFNLLLFFFVTHISLLTMLLGHIVFVNNCSNRNENCTYENETLLIVCEESWVTETVYYRKNKSPVDLVYYFINIILYIILGNAQGGFSVNSSNAMIPIIILSVVACITKCYYIPKAVSYLAGGLHSFTKHRDNHRLFWMFINNEGANKQIAQRIYNYFVFEYTRMKGINMNRVIQSLHPALQYDLAFAMYYNAMRCMHSFVGPDKTFMKLLSNKLIEVFYQNDIPVILNNGANDKIYFICEGYINIYRCEDEKMKTLGPGSMFGSFRKRGLKRHKLMFTSKFHSNLLMVPTVDFMQILKAYNEDYFNKFLQLTKFEEFLEYLDDSDIFILNELDYKNVKHSIILHQNAPAYRWIMFFLSIIVPYLTAFPVMFCVSVSKYNDNLELQVIIYILDLISLLRIYFGLYATYTDELTDLYISNLRQIRYNYVVRSTGFLLDFLSLFPFEVIGYMFVRRWITVLMLNRLLRLQIMMNYIKFHRERTYVRIWLRWFEFVCIVTIPPFSFTCFWMYVTCTDGCLINYNENILNITQPYEKLLYSLGQTINLLTFTASYELTKPWNFTECLTIIFFNIMGFFLLPTMIAKFMQTSIMSNYNKRIYEYNIYCMKIYLQLRDLSVSLLDKLWNYSLLLYKTDQGHDVPPYIENSPLILKSELFSDLYGGHIKYNILFENCNIELIHQLCALLRRTVYFPGDFIIRKMDVDNRMYFINSGEVDELEFDEMNKEVIKAVYITGQCFGLAQGLYERTPHFNNYKARTMVEILTLQKSDWIYLVDLFTDDFRNIFKMARKISLITLVSQQNT